MDALGDVLEHVTNPFALAAFALGVAFLLVTRSPLARKSWKMQAAMALAGICVVGALVIAALDAVLAEPPETGTGTIEQRSGGDCAPNIAGTTGDVTIACD